MNRKKLLSVLFLLCTNALLLFGCSNNSNSSISDSASTTAQTVSSAEAVPSTQVEWYTSGAYYENSNGETRYENNNETVSESMSYNQSKTDYIK